MSNIEKSLAKSLGQIFDSVIDHNTNISNTICYLVTVIPNFQKKIDFKDMKSPAKIRDVHKIEKNNSIGIIAFGYEHIVKYPMYVSKKCCEEKHVDLLLIE